MLGLHVRGWMTLGICVIIAQVGLAQTPKDVINKAVEAHGGAANLKKYMGARAKAKGKMSLLGMDIDFTGETTIMLPGQSKSVITMNVGGNKVAITQIFNNGKLKILLADQAMPVDEKTSKEVKEEANMQMCYQLVPLLDEKTYKLSMIENPGKLGDQELVGILVKGEGFSDVKLFFDKKTNLLVKLERRGLDANQKEGVQEFINLEFKKFDGITRPVKSEVRHDGKKFMTTEITEYKHFEKIEPKEFDISD